MENTIPEVHPPGDPGSDISVPVDTQCLCEENMGKDEGPIGVQGLPEYPLPFLSQYGRELVPYCARGSGVPASQLCG